MKPFSLDNVLDYRKRLEEIAASRLHDAQRQQKAVQLRLDHEQDKLAIIIKRTEEIQGETIPILDFINSENKIAYLKKNIQAIKENLQDKISNSEKERQNLIAKSKDRQIMESLKEKQNLAWKVYLNKKEAAMLDEIAIVRHDTGR